MQNQIPMMLVPLLVGALGCSVETDHSTRLEPPGDGPYAVGSTNLQVADRFADMGNDAMHEVLLGRPDNSGQPRYLADILEFPDSAFTTNVSIPNQPEIFGPASGLSLPVVSFVTYPSRPGDELNRYAFPYHNAQYGVFEDMLGPSEMPRFADPDQRYPLILLAHGASAHGVYDVRHAHKLSSHGYIVAVLNFGDDRTAVPDTPNDHIAYLRPFLTKAVLDDLLESKDFGSNIDADNIGITGHSFGGFTALAIAGGPFQGNLATSSDERIKAGVIAAPYVGGNYGDGDIYAFGPDNAGLNRVTVPIISLFGTSDTVTEASFILPAMKQLSGSTYVVELVDQPHVFEAGSWEDRDNWEMLFFAAYLKHDPLALAKLRTGRSMQGGNEDVQLFDFQKLVGEK